ncbi:unnamed protein product, partial [Didymodactylos carnosus]
MSSPRDKKESVAEAENGHQVLSDDIFLFWASGSLPCWRVQIVLEEKNLNGYKNKLVSLDRNEHKSGAVLKQNPRGQVPSLNFRSVVLNESMATCIFLDSSKKHEGTRLIPEEHRLQARVLQLTFD